MNTIYGVDYEWLLGELGDVTPIADGGSVTLRHDVDHSMAVALDMARIEHSLCVRSTYFLLTPGWGQSNYLGSWVAGRFVMSPEGKSGIAELVKMGHEVGYHNNLVTVSRQSGTSPVDLLGSVMSEFSRYVDGPIGTASHGDREARLGGYVNYDFIREYDGDLSELGIAYEAYSMPRAGYLSDSGGKNLTLCVGQDDAIIFPEPKKHAFSRAIGGLDKPAQVLIHPWWWRW